VSFSQKFSLKFDMCHVSSEGLYSCYGYTFGDILLPKRSSVLTFSSVVMR